MTGLLLTAAFSAIQPAANAYGGPAETDYRNAIDSVRALVAQEMHDQALPGLSVALVDDQRVVWAAGFGYANVEKRILATPDTIYRVGSISKLFTDIAIMQQVERGTLNLDGPIAQYLPNFHPSNVFGAPITLRELMTHRAGLVREPPVGNYFDDSQPSVASVVASLNETSLVYAPGTRTKYTNVGDTVAALVLQQVTGEPYERYIQSSVLDPLGMTRSTFYPLAVTQSGVAQGYEWNYAGKTYGAPAFQLGTGPAGNLTSSVIDLARFLSWIFSDRQDSDHILSSASIQSMFAPEFPDSNGEAAFGIGFARNNVAGHPMVGHRGGVYGFSSELLAFPDQRLGAVVVTNLDHASEVTWHIATRALLLMLAAKSGKHYLSRLTTPVPPSEARRLDGFYGKGDNEYRLFERTGDLYMEPVGDGEITKLRRYDDHLITDDRTGWGFEVIPQKGGISVIGYSKMFLPKVPPPPAHPLPSDWRKLLGTYGPWFNPMEILDRYGTLTALLEMEYIPLVHLAGDQWSLSPQSAYAGETLTFIRGKDGRVISARVGYVTFHRHPQ